MLIVLEDYELRIKFMAYRHTFLTMTPSNLELADTFQDNAINAVCNSEMKIRPLRRYSCTISKCLKIMQSVNGFKG